MTLVFRSSSISHDVLQAKIPEGSTALQLSHDPSICIYTLTAHTVLHCLPTLHVFVCGCEKVSVREVSQTRNQTLSSSCVTHITSPCSQLSLSFLSNFCIALFKTCCHNSNTVPDSPTGRPNFLTPRCEPPPPPLWY